MPYVSLTLKYRPSTFTDVVGQEHVTRTLRNAVAAGRVHHAYLFSGPRGTGKTSVARVLAKALNCEHGPTPEPCGTCAACAAIRDGRALDIVEIDAASNRGIDEIRELREKVKYSPAEARHKLYILDEVHMLTNEAFNALLKTLEEPPAHAFFVLATTEAHRVPATIVSRCQRFEFRRLGIQEIVGALRAIAEAEGIEIDGDALAAVARAADGGMRDSQSILDQLRAYAEGKIDLATVNTVLGATEVQTLVELVDAVQREDYRAICATVDRVIAAGKDLGQLLDDLMDYCRDLSRLALGCEPVGPAAGAVEAPAIAEQARGIGAERAMSLMTHFAEVRQAFKQSTQHGLLLETALLEAGRPVRPAAPAIPPVAAPVPAPAPPRRGPAREGRPERPASSPPATRSSASAPPVEAAPTAPAAPPPAGELRPEVVRQYWPHMQSALRRMRRLPVWAMVQDARPAAVTGNVVTLSFGAQHKFHHGKVAGELRGDVERALSEVLGASVTIEAVLEEGSSAPPPPVEPPPAPAEPPPAPAPGTGPVEQVKQAFPGSTVVDGPPGAQG